MQEWRALPCCGCGAVAGGQRTPLQPHTWPQQQPPFGVRAVLLVRIVEQWRMATTCSVRQHSAWRCGDNVRRLAAIPRPSPGESMLRLVVHSIAGRRQSEQRSPIALFIAARAALLIRFHTFLGWLALGAWKPAKMADSILARTKRGCSPRGRLRSTAGWNPTCCFSPRPPRKQSARVRARPPQSGGLW